MEDDEFMRERIEALEASVQFFSNDSKAKRELWVVGSFLTNLGIAYLPDELISVELDPPDVEYKDARFEIKEILDSGRKRDHEYKAELEKARRAKSASELIEHFTPIDSSLSEMCRLCMKQIENLREKYSDGFRAETDLLFYVNLQSLMNVIEDQLPSAKELEKEGWRSVSFLEGHSSCCLYASQSAPSFLQSAVGAIFHCDK